MRIPGTLLASIILTGTIPVAACAVTFDFGTTIVYASQNAPGSWTGLNDWGWISGSLHFDLPTVDLHPDDPTRGIFRAENASIVVRGNGLYERRTGMLEIGILKDGDSHSAYLLFGGFMGMTVSNDDMGQPAWFSLQSDSIDSLFDVEWSPGYFTRFGQDRTGNGWWAYNDRGLHMTLRDGARVPDNGSSALLLAAVLILLGGFQRRPIWS